MMKARLTVFPNASQGSSSTIQFPESLVVPSGAADRQLYFRLNCSALSTVSFGFTWTEL